MVVVCEDSTWKAAAVGGGLPEVIAGDYCPLAFRQVGSAKGQRVNQCLPVGKPMVSPWSAVVFLLTRQTAQTNNLGEF